MPEIPPQAFEAATEALADYETQPYRDLRLNSERAAAKAVCAAAPLVAEQARAAERARIAETLRQLGDWPDGYARFRNFVECNNLQDPKDRPLFSAFLLALSDMVRGGGDA